LQSQKRALIDQIKTEEEKKRKILEADLKKCDQDMNRIRTARDNLQRTLDLKNAEQDTTKKQLNEVELVANARKSRIEALQSELARVKLQVGIDIGEIGLIRFFGDMNESNPYAVLSSQIKELEDIKKVLESTISEMNSEVYC
jgi:E3 ubiquitin-protein ligase BRE1